MARQDRRALRGLLVLRERREAKDRRVQPDLQAQPALKV
jgi:hypothetical protein